MAATFAVIIGVGGVLLVFGLTILLVWFFKFRHKNFSSETGSSDPSAAVVEITSGRVDDPYSSSPVTISSSPEAKKFRMQELEQATRCFHDSNLIGHGTFGQVFKGLLSDGTIVAIKRRSGPPQQEFGEEVARLSRIRHRNLVKLLGYCQENGFLMLVFEYLPNGSIKSYLHDSMTKLDFKQRLSISVWSARGLCHLHSLLPPLPHGNFRTANVLVDETLIAKVSDTGVSKLIAIINGALASSASSSFNAFRDPELGPHDMPREENDVYSFGILLLKLISGKKLTDEDAFQSNNSSFQWVQDHLRANELIDDRLEGSFTEEGMKNIIRLMQKCTRFPGTGRPRMGNVVMELEQILENEIKRTTVMGESIANITLGSQLFTN